MEVVNSFTDSQKTVDDFAGDRLHKEQAMAMMAKHNETLPETPDRNEYGFIATSSQPTIDEPFMGSQGTEKVIKEYLRNLYKDKETFRVEKMETLEQDLQDKEAEKTHLQVLLRDYEADLENVATIKKLTAAKRTKKQKELLMGEKSLEERITDIKENRLPTIDEKKVEKAKELLLLKDQADRDRGEEDKAMDFASITAHAVQKATGALFEKRDFLTSTPFKLETKVQPNAFTRIETGVDIPEKDKLLVSGGRIIQIGEDARVGDILTPNWKDYGARKNFKIYFEELYLYLLRPEYVETEVALEVIADMGMAFSKDAPDEQAKYGDFMQKIFDVQALVIRRKSTLSRKGMGKAKGAIEKHKKRTINGSKLFLKKYLSTINGYRKSTTKTPNKIDKLFLGLVTAVGGVFTRDRQQELASMLQDKMAVTVYALELKKVAHFPTRMALGQAYKGEKKPRRFGKNINLRLNFGIVKAGFKRPFKSNNNNRNNNNGGGKPKRGKWSKDGKPICDGCGKTGHIKKNCRTRQGGGGRQQNHQQQPKQENQHKNNNNNNNNQSEKQ